jgi:hypothetical protein
VLGGLRADKRIGKLQAVASAISAEPLASRVARIGVNGHNVHSRKQCRDRLALAGSLPRTNFRPAYRRVSKRYASRSVRGYPLGGPSIVAKDLD